MNNVKRTTLATIKSFIKREFSKNSLYVKQLSSFDGMIDCVRATDDEFRKVEKLDWENKNSFGIRGAWFVGSSGDSFEEFGDANYIGWNVYNCCGSFILAFPL